MFIRYYYSETLFNAEHLPQCCYAPQLWIEIILLRKHTAVQNTKWKKIIDLQITEGFVNQIVVSIFRHSHKLIHPQGYCGMQNCFLQSNTSWQIQEISIPWVPVQKHYRKPLHSCRGQIFKQRIMYMLSHGYINKIFDLWILQHKLIAYPIESSRNGGAKPKKIDVRRDRTLQGEKSGSTIAKPAKTWYVKKPTPKSLRSSARANQDNNNQKIAHMVSTTKWCMFNGV